jgi:hypothetical protein
MEGLIIRSADSFVREELNWGKCPVKRLGLVLCIARPSIRGLGGPRSKNLASQSLESLRLLRKLGSRVCVGEPKKLRVGLQRKNCLINRGFSKAMQRGNGDGRGFCPVQ